ncbi:CPBP family intramembrane glutamic endopeptidase [Priestia megaterium]|uniref:CPBP family intramembrane glutamic endopeptidase n=1 Tax=Priestia megaterium TaxID=1404 RepID=UPI0023DA4D28|nr:CPBP family intramembrane glutamic endopeptidase [Priestia megaterium]MDF2052694.1 CPBP family intramembrane metalloprotease [Priestia megaterium]MDF2058816.1 CPBP family intramembrane metalloprotease [Priestia megaterium]
MKNYLDVEEGKNGWKRYLSTTILASAFMLLGSIIYIVAEMVMVALDESGRSYFDYDEGIAVGVNATLDFLISHVVHLFWLFGLWIGIRFIQKRRMRSLITANERINWKRIFWSFSMFSALLIVTQLIDVAFNHKDYAWNYVSFKEYVPLVLITFLLVPIQTTTEELFFRGLLLQWVGKKVKKPILLAIIVGIMFSIGHFANPEMNKSIILVGLDYIVAGFALTYIAIKTKSLEITIGAHAANNMFLALFLTTDDSVYGSIPSLFKAFNTEPGANLIWTIITFIVFYILCRKKIKKEEAPNED